MKMVSRGIVLATALAGALAGCASTPSVQDTETIAISRLIAEKVAVAAEAQREYVALVNENKAALSRKQAAIEKDEVDIDYIGKPQELLQTLAHRYGYRYIESGKRTDLRIINVRVQKTPPIEVLRNIGYQIDPSADVVLDKRAKTIRLIYKTPGGQQG